MTRLASWADYGTHDESAYPELWRGCVGAWAPCLGPTGLRLHDLSRYRNWGTLTNMDAATDWVVSGGRYALDLDGENDRVTARPITYQRLTLTSCCWVKPNSVSGVQMLVTHYGAEGNRAWYLALINNAVRILVSPDGTTIPFGQGGTVSTEWTHLACVVTPTQFLIYVNGIPVTTTLTGTFPSQIFNSTADLMIGGREAIDMPFNGLVDDVLLYNRVLSPAEHRLLATRRGIAYERRKRRSVFFNAAFFNPVWARNSNLILSPVGAA